MNKKIVVVLSLACAAITGCAQKEIIASDHTYLSSSNPPLNLNFPDSFELVDESQSTEFSRYADSYGGSKVKIKRHTWAKRGDDSAFLIFRDLNLGNSRNGEWRSFEEHNPKLCNGKKVSIQNTDFQICAHPNNGQDGWSFSNNDNKSCGNGVRFQFMRPGSAYRQTIITYAEQTDCSNELSSAEYTNLVSRALKVLQ